MPYFLVSLLKSYSLNLRDLRLKPCIQVGALTLLSAARTKGRCGARKRPTRKHTRAMKGICTRFDMLTSCERQRDVPAGHSRPAKGRFSRGWLTTPASVQAKVAIEAVLSTHGRRAERPERSEAGAACRAAPIRTRPRLASEAYVMRLVPRSSQEPFEVLTF